MIHADTVVITGEEVSDAAIQLWEGWNLVGYGSSTERYVEDALFSIYGTYYSVWAYDNPPGEWLVYFADDPSLLSNLIQMEPEKGYWIYATNDCTWDVNASGP